MTYFQCRFNQRRCMQIVFTTYTCCSSRILLASRSSFLQLYYNLGLMISRQQKLAMLNLSYRPCHMLSTFSCTENHRRQCRQISRSLASRSARFSSHTTDQSLDETELYNYQPLIESSPSPAHEKSSYVLLVAANIDISMEFGLPHTVPGEPI